MRIIDLERNDVESAVAYIKEKIGTKAWDPSDTQMLIMLQDDPTELLARLEELFPE